MIEDQTDKASLRVLREGEDAYIELETRFRYVRVKIDHLLLQAIVGHAEGHPVDVEFQLEYKKG